VLRRPPERGTGEERASRTEEWNAWAVKRFGLQFWAVKKPKVLLRNKFAGRLVIIVLQTSYMN
jgi:hypothetical protein